MIYVAIIIVCVIYILYIRKKKYVLDFPGPPGIPLLGNWFDIYYPENMLDALEKYTKKYGKSIKLYGGIETVIFTSDTGIVEKIMNSKDLLTKSREYDYLKPWLGNGLLTSTGNTWRNRRKILTPTFHYSILEDFVKVFETHSVILIKNLDKNVGKDSFDIQKLIGAYTLDVVCDAAMGTNVNVQCNPHHKFPKAIHELCGIMFKRFTLWRYDFMYKWTHYYKRELELVAYLNKFSMDILQKRKQVLMNSEGDKLDKKKNTSFLDRLLIDNYLTDEEIREEVDTFLFGGLDTSSVAISFFILNIANNKDVQDKVVLELIEILGTDSETISMENLNNLKYLEMAIKESMRVYPVAPLLGRVITTDFEFEGAKMPKGTNVLMNVWSIHRNENVFPDPLKFDPERFSYGNVNKYKPFEYIPFSAGHRNCIGQKFGMLEMKMVIAKMLLKYEFKPAIPEFVPRLCPTVTLSSLNGVQVRLERRLL